MGRYVWSIATNKDNAWIIWVNVLYIHQPQWWDYAPNLGASWYWMRVFYTKEFLKQFYSPVERFLCLNIL